MKRARTILVVGILFILSGWLHSQEIFDAVRNSDMAKVRSLVESDPRLIQAKDETGRTPLHWAARGVHFEILRYLIDKGAEVNVGESDGTTPLHCAASRGHLDACKLLIAKGAAIGVKNQSGATPFYYAALGGDKEVLEYLLAKGANKSDLEQRLSWGRTPLCAIARDDGDAQKIRVLIGIGADINAADASGMTPIMLAAWRPNREVVDVLIDAGADLQILTPRGEELTTYAAENGLEKLFQRLLAGKAALNMLNEDGGTLLHSAAAGGSRRIVLALIAQGFDVNRRDSYGWVPLHLAAEQGHKEIVSLLVKSGAAIDARNKLGQSAYNIAIEREDAGLADLLKSLRADPSAPKFPRIKGRYLGRPLPGKKPEPFAPGIVFHRYKPHSTVAVSPAGDEIFWNPMIESRGGGYSYGYIMTTKIKDGLWTYPQKAAFSERDFHDDHPLFSADGQKLYFLSRRPNPGTGEGHEGQPVWYVEKTSTGWSEPKNFASLPLPVGPDVTFLTYSFDGQGDYVHSKNGDIYYSRLADGIYSAPEKMPETINSGEVEVSPLLSAKGDYLLFIRGIGDSMQPWVSFKDPDGGWTPAVSLRAHIGNLKYCWNLARSGKYLMLGGAHWIDAGFIETVRPQR